MRFAHEGMKRLRHEAFAEQTLRCASHGFCRGEHCSSGYRVRLLLNRKTAATTKVVERLRRLLYDIYPIKQVLWGPQVIK